MVAAEVASEMAVEMAAEVAADMAAEVTADMAAEVAVKAPQGFRPNPKVTHEMDCQMPLVHFHASPLLPTPRLRYTCVQTRRDAALSELHSRHLRLVNWSRGQ